MDPRRPRHLIEPRPVRVALTLAALAFAALFLLAPLLVVFHGALAEGWGVAAAAVRAPEARAALRLTLLISAFVVPLNTLFGLAAAWAIARHEFRGRHLLLTIIDVPFSVSPVIAGMMFVFLFGARSLMGRWFLDRGMTIIFAVPGMVMATLFVASPLVARELIPLLQAQGRTEEEAALTLGAGGLRTFLKISLPKIRWALAYGVVLCNARAMGEFGAVSVVSGHVRGVTTTLPLYVEMLYNEYQMSAAFAASAILTLLALVTLFLRAIIEWRTARRLP